MWWRNALDYVECPYEAEVNVVLTDNEAIQEINRDIAGHRPSHRRTFFSYGATLRHQEILDGLEETRGGVFQSGYRRADAGGYRDLCGKGKGAGGKISAIPETRELAFLVAHSMLHLSGYDHMEDEERLDMEDKQRGDSGTEGLQEMRRHGRKGIMVLAAAVLAVTLPGAERSMRRRR